LEASEAERRSDRGCSVICSWNRTKLIEILSDRAVDIPLEGGWGTCWAKGVTSHSKRPYLVRKAVLRSSLDDTVTRGYCAVHLAARGGHDEILEILLWHEASVHVASERFCT
jgi:hypothetical protein